MLETINFYKYSHSPIRLSFYLRWSSDKKNDFNKTTNIIHNRRISLLAFCIMPNHFHFLLKQEQDNGISKFMSDFQNSITRYINTLSGRKGHIFQGQFKAVLVQSEAQLLHVSRYIHLNPYSSYVVKNINDLKEYPWSSLPEYLKEKLVICDTENMLSKLIDEKKYWDFIKDHSDYQRELESIKHLIFE